MELATYWGPNEVTKCIPVYSTYTSFFATEGYLKYKADGNTGFNASLVHKTAGMTCGEVPVPDKHFNGGGIFLSDYDYLNYCFEGINQRYIFSLATKDYGSSLMYAL